ncbi:MAG TPA: metallophosphoesterase family protein [Methylomirabilota bacterium]|nr:metallophosphoesterase family protein [Methylomirabilota bacterium]
MRIALLTDIHGNLEALDACLEEVASVGADRIVCLGDVVGYGADPEACVDRIAALCDAGAVCIRGNHDAAVETGGDDMSAAAATAIAWTAARLSAGAKAFLGRLPIAHREGEVLCVHASADVPDRWTYVLTADEAALSLAATDAWLVLSGHTHVPALFSVLTRIAGTTGKVGSFAPPANKPVPLSRVRRHHAVIGSVGQPRDGDPRACWGILDLAAGDIVWRRTPYDIDAAARKIREAGLPRRLAERLSVGR